MSCEKSYFPPKRARSSLECKDKDTSCTAFFWFVSLLRLNLQKSTFIYKSLHLSTFHGLKSLQKSTFIYKSLQESTKIYISLQKSSRICIYLQIMVQEIFKNLQFSSKLFKTLQNSSKLFNFPARDYRKNGGKVHCKSKEEIGLSVKDLPFLLKNSSTS